MVAEECGIGLVPLCRLRRSLIVAMLVVVAMVTLPPRVVFARIS